MFSCSARERWLLTKASITARLNKLNVEKYLAYVLERIGSADASELMPWSDSLPDDLKAS